MRIAVAVLACLGVGTLTIALADPPATTPTATSTTAAASTTAATSTPVAMTAPAVQATKSTPSKDDLTYEEKHFINEEGYHLEMRHGEKVYCRYNTETGSRVNRQKICGTIQELKSAEEQAQAGKDLSVRMQQNKSIN